MRNLTRIQKLQLVAHIIAKLKANCTAGGPKCHTLNALNYSAALQVPREATAPACDERAMASDQHDMDLCQLLERASIRYVLPVLLLLCVLGNGLNLLVYTSTYFRGNSAIRLLQAKALANIGYLASLAPEMLDNWLESRVTDTWAVWHWQSKPYQIFSANFSGTLATWFTLLITIETLCCILRPMAFRQWFTAKVSWAMVTACLLASGALHSAFLLSRKVVLLTRPLNASSTVCSSAFYALTARDGPLTRPLTVLYFWGHSGLVILAPTLLMLFCTALIIAVFKRKMESQPLGNHWRCVIQLTTATTLCHLVLEGPSVLIYVTAALKGSPSRRQHRTSVCLATVLTNFLSLANASLPFFLYWACNQTFRRLLWQRAKATEPGRGQAKFSNATTGASFEKRSVVNNRLTNWAATPTLGTAERNRSPIGSIQTGTG